MARSILPLNDNFFDLYDDDYYIGHSKDPQYSQTRLVGMELARLLNPHSVLDVGCGVGAMLRGVWDADPTCSIMGIDAPKANEIIRRLNISSIPAEARISYDLRDLKSYPSSAPTSNKYDLAMSFETGEHLPIDIGPKLVDFMSDAATKYIAWTSAPPGRGGETHINERPRDYWVGLYEKRGWVIDSGHTNAIKGVLNGRIDRVGHYLEALIFVRV